MKLILKRHMKQLLVLMMLFALVVQNFVPMAHAGRVDDIPLTVTPTSRTVNAPSGYFTVSVLSSEAPKVKSNDPDWLIVSNITSTGFKVEYEENTGVKRKGTITVRTSTESKTLTVTQNPPPIAVNPVALAFQPSGGTKTVAITTASGSWYVDEGSVPDWLTCTKSGNTLSVKAANIGIAPAREASILLKSGSTSTILYVSQNAHNLKINTPAQTVPAGSGSFQVEIEAGGKPNVSTNASWLTVLEDTVSSTGFTVTYEANTRPVQRTGKITVSASGKTVELAVTQGSLNSITATPGALDFLPTGGTKTVGVTTASGSWYVDEGSVPNWLTCTKSGSTLSVKASDIGSSRSREASILLKSGNASTIVYVSQNAYKLELQNDSDKNISVPARYSTYAVGITANATPTVVTDVTWLSVTNVTSSSFTVNHALNSSNKSRTGKVIISVGPKSETLTVTQAPNTITATPGTLEFLPSGDTKTVTVTTASGSWRVDEGSIPNWLTCTQSGSTLSVKALEIGSGLSREASILLKSGGASTIVYVFQNAYNLELPETMKTVTAKSGLFSVGITANATPTVETDASWLTITNVTKTGFKVKHSTNTSAQPRTGVITVKVGPKTETFTVTQEKDAIIIDPVGLDFPPAGGTKTVTVTIPSGGSWRVFGERFLEDWLHCEKVGNKLKVTVDNIGSNSSREAQIIIRSGLLEATIYVTQADCDCARCHWTAVSYDFPVTVLSSHYRPTVLGMIPAGAPFTVTRLGDDDLAHVQYTDDDGNLLVGVAMLIDAVDASEPRPTKPCQLCSENCAGWYTFKDSYSQLIPVYKPHDVNNTKIGEITFNEPIYVYRGSEEFGWAHIKWNDVDGNEVDACVEMEKLQKIESPDDYGCGYDEYDGIPGCRIHERTGYVDYVDNAETTKEVQYRVVTVSFSSKDNSTESPLHYSQGRINVEQTQGAAGEQNWISFLGDSMLIAVSLAGSGTPQVVAETVSTVFDILSLCDHLDSTTPDTVIQNGANGTALITADKTICFVWIYWEDAWYLAKRCERVEGNVTIVDIRPEKLDEIGHARTDTEMDKFYFAQGSCSYDLDACVRVVAEHHNEMRNLLSEFRSTCNFPVNEVKVRIWDDAPVSMETDSKECTFKMTDYGVHGFAAGSFICEFYRNGDPLWYVS